MCVRMGKRVYREMLYCKLGTVKICPLITGAGEAHLLNKEHVPFLSFRELLLSDNYYQSRFGFNMFHFLHISELIA